MDSKGSGKTAVSVVQHSVLSAGGCPTARALAFCLDGWLVKPDSNELIELGSLSSGDQQRRSLEPRLMHLLSLLAAAPQRVFSREELMSALWPRVIVNENSLTRAVSELRKQLALPGSTTRFIDTIPKTGYRLSADCKVREYIEPVCKPVYATTGRWTAFITSARGFALAASFTLAAVLLGSLQLPFSNPDASESAIALADIHVSSQAAFDALLDGRLETVAAQSSSQDGEMLVEIEKLDATQPVVSRDGGLFAYIRHHDQGSSLVLGSTQLPSSPITVFTTEDAIYNLQWSPIDRALLFAQSPRITTITTAAMLPLDEQASLVLFDLDSFTTRVLFGPGSQSPAPEGTTTTPADDVNHNDAPRGFKLTALARSLDWLS
ncbi:MAG: winged helix-turn-helix domain-containing protein [Gammaproteobacteria bacterium]|nr:winged helix-turn-helix domain-containing protein [Gammaproteobacteria bacterium]